MIEITLKKAFDIVFLVVLGAAAWQDKRRLRVGKKFLFIASIFAILGRSLIINKQITLIEWVVSLLPGVFLLGLGWLSCWQIGAGDGAVILVMGLWIGYEKTIAIMLAGMLLCSLFCGILILFRKVGRKTEIPFVPFLLAAYFACLIGGIFR